MGSCGCSDFGEGVSSTDGVQQNLALWGLAEAPAGDLPGQEDQAQRAPGWGVGSLCKGSQSWSPASSVSQCCELWQVTFSEPVVP